MKAPEHRNGDGIGTAKALLGLIDEHSSRDFKAAEAVLGGNESLAHLLQLLREIKERQESAGDPITLETFQELFRKELLRLAPPPAYLAEIAEQALGARVRLQPSSSFPDIVGQVLGLADKQWLSPSECVFGLATILLRTARGVGVDSLARITVALQELAKRAISENTILFPNHHAISQLRLRWAERPLPYSPGEPRYNVVERLIDDLQHLPDEEDIMQYTVTVLAEGMRGPADHAIATVRRMSPKKAKAHGG